MSRYRFLGQTSQIGPIKLNQFGQQVELPDQLAEDAMSGGCALLPEAVFNQIGFTATELDRFATPGSHADAPAEFLDKKKQAISAYQTGGLQVQEQPAETEPTEEGE